MPLRRRLYILRKSFRERRDVGLLKLAGYLVCALKVCEGLFVPTGGFFPSQVQAPEGPQAKFLQLSGKLDGSLVEPPPFLCIPEPEVRKACGC